MCAAFRREQTKHDPALSRLFQRAFSSFPSTQCLAHSHTCSCRGSCHHPMASVSFVARAKPWPMCLMAPPQPWIWDIMTIDMTCPSVHFCLPPGQTAPALKHHVHLLSCGYAFPQNNIATDKWLDIVPWSTTIHPVVLTKPFETATEDAMSRKQNSYANLKEVCKSSQPETTIVTIKVCSRGFMHVAAWHYPTSQPSESQCAWQQWWLLRMKS